MKPTIRLKRANKDRICHSPHLTYHVLYDYAAGKQNRYTVMIINVDDPVVVGRELDLATIRELVADYDNEANAWTEFRAGIRRDIIKLRDRVIIKRRGEYQ